MKFEFERRFDLPPERLFAFHENPDNLVRLLRGWPSFEMVSHAGHIRVGAVTRVRERQAFVWMPMTFEHFLYEPPQRFAERLRRGPFKKFEHIHEFVAAGGGTLVRDRLDIELSWWLGGELGMRLVVAPKMRRFFAYRHAELERLVRDGTVARLSARATP